MKAIAEDAGITEMTFFNYFKKKEDVLRYMMGTWIAEFVVLQQQKTLKGEKAIRRFFSHTADKVATHPGLMVSYISYLVTNEMDPSPNILEPADRYLCFPDQPDVWHMELKDGNELLIQYLQEFDPQADHQSSLLHLASAFFGDVLIAHTANRNLGSLYTESLDLIFGSFKKQSK